MRVIKITIFLIFTVLLNGCVYTTPSYEVFAGNMDNQVKYWESSEYMVNNIRQVYDENRYIYIFEHIIEGCVYGYLTNRDDKPEVVQEWIILSGKENCKITESFVLIQ